MSEMLKTNTTLKSLDLNRKEKKETREREQNDE